MDPNPVAPRVTAPGACPISPGRVLFFRMWDGDGHYPSIFCPLEGRPIGQLVTASPGEDGIEAVVKGGHGPS
jgi:hypothetical protein